MPVIRLLILDVDGVLTSGALPYDGDGDSHKTFHVRDGGAVRLWQSAGGHAALLSGRRSPAVVARARDLGIETVHQGASDKLPVYLEICRRLGIGEDETAFVGDDLLDLPVLRRCGYPIAPADAAPIVKRAARHVTRRAAGRGAVAEVVERLLRHNGTWLQAMAPWLSGELTGVGAESADGASQSA